MSICSCDISSYADEVSPENVANVLMELSAIEGAQYYVDNRENITFLDSLYAEDILPALEDCDYFELKRIKSITQNTPYNEVITEWCRDKRAECLELIEKEINENKEIEKEAFLSSIVPAIRLDIDENIEEDVDEVMSQYAGGLLNYRKLAFLFGRNRNDFKQMFWEKFDTLKYQEIINNHVKTYLDSLQVNQSAYSVSLTETEFSFQGVVNPPKFVIGLSQSTLRHVNKYTSGEKDEIMVDAVKDYVIPIALGMTTGPGAALIATTYDVATLAYDVKVTIDDIQSDEPSKDDVVKYICEHDLTYQIDNFYLNKWIERVLSYIDESNRQLYMEISKAL